MLMEEALIQFPSYCKLFTLRVKQDLLGKSTFDY